MSRRDAGGLREDNVGDKSIERIELSEKHKMET